LRIITQSNFYYRIAHPLVQVFSRYSPFLFLGENDIYTAQDNFFVGTTENITPAFNGFRPLCNVTDGDIWHMEQAALFLYGPTVTYYTTGVLFQSYEIKKAKRFDKPDRSVVNINIIPLNFILCPRVKTADYRYVMCFAERNNWRNRVSVSTFSARCMVTRKYFPGSIRNRSNISDWSISFW
jgi:hypothetical protein